MKRQTVILLAVVLAALLQVAGHANEIPETERSRIEQAVLETNKQMVQAAESKDLDKLFSYVLENDRGAVIQDGKILLTRKDIMDSTREGFQALESIDYQIEREHVTVLSEKHALLVAEGVTHAMTKNGNAFSVRFAQSILFELKDGKWMVLHAHRSFPDNR